MKLKKKIESTELTVIPVICIAWKWNNSIKKNLILNDEIKKKTLIEKKNIEKKKQIIISMNSV
jgi:hypothetical protein